jgi:hypothetical protein
MESTVSTVIPSKHIRPVRETTSV